MQLNTVYIKLRGVRRQFQQINPGLYDSLARNNTSGPNLRSYIVEIEISLIEAQLRQSTYLTCHGNTRPNIFYPLPLALCPILVGRQPDLEPILETLFGLSSREAWDLVQLDVKRRFRVEDVLSQYATHRRSRLDIFTGPFRQWLEAMRRLLSDQSLLESNPTLVLSAEKLAEEYCEKAALILQLLDISWLLQAFEGDDMEDEPELENPIWKRRDGTSSVSLGHAYSSFGLT